MMRDDTSLQRQIKMINKPKQPCSIYNLFFQLERECLLHEYVPTRSQDIIREIVNRRNDGQNVDLSKDFDQRPPRYRHLTLPDDWFKSGTKKRKHRKTNLPFGFLQLNKIISEKWDSVDEETKAFLKKIASSEWDIYRAKHKKFVEQTMTKTTEVKANSTENSKNHMDSGEMKHSCDSDVKNVTSFTKRHNNSSSNVKFDCGSINHLHEQESWCDPHSSTGNTMISPFNIDAATKNLDPIPIRCFSMPHVHQAHAFGESTKNGGLNVQAKHNSNITKSLRQYSSMPIFHHQPYHMNPFNGRLNDNNNGDSKSNAEFQDQDLRQCQQRARSALLGSSSTHPVELLIPSNQHSPQKLISFAQDLDTIQSFLRVVSERKQSQSTQMHIEALSQTQELLQMQAQAKHESNTVGYCQLGHGCNLNQNSLNRTGNASFDQDTWTEISTCNASTYTDTCSQNASLPHINGSNTWHCSAIESANNHEVAKVDSTPWIGDANSIALASKETNIEESDFPPGSFHPVDDSLAFHPNGGPCDI